MRIRLDNCPQCLAPDQTAEETYPLDGGYTALYRCAACGHVWATAWEDD